MALGKLNRLGLLAELYGEVLIPRAVYEEVVTRGLALGMPDALNVRLFWQHQRWPVMDVPESALAAYSPPVTLGIGEIEVLVLAQSMPSTMVLLDDEIARTEARRLGLSVRGTLGILVDSYRQGLLTFVEIELLIHEIASRPDIWIAGRLCESVLASLRKSPIETRDE
jgi:predicted nucleic acid-binding protein